jgi:predicted alpha/beta-fold hydrolase
LTDITLYHAPFWLPSGHVQTIWAALLAEPSKSTFMTFKRERWTTPDGDFIDVDRHTASDPSRPLLVLFHGLEGSSSSHYARAFAKWAIQHDLHLALPHFRGCSGEMNWAPRAYHSGDHQEIDWILRRLRKEHQAQGGQCMVAVGVSLGGNALMRWAAEHAEQASQQVEAVASICAPLDLMASGQAIGEGLSRYIYTPMFLRSMKPKALAKWAQHPGLFDKEAVMASKTLRAFDNAFTAPVHGFKDTDDYWTQASAKPMMRRIRLPALALNALNDPFIPTHSLPSQEDVSSSVTIWQPQQGGHVGFPSGPWPSHVHALPQAVGAWMMNAAGYKMDTGAHGHG